jgi:quinol monooxygenase YgiN
MICRIVKMTFRKEESADFIQLFQDVREKIRNFEGCTHLELLRDKDQPHVFFTYSKWKSEDHLNRYRNSSLFLEVWPRTKAMFGEKAQAWTLDIDI